jgi:hypothetical protein
MNSTQLGGRLMFLAKELRLESNRHTGKTRAELLRGSRQLSYAYTAAFSKDPDLRAQAEALVDGAIDYLVDVITTRTDRELTEGTKQ